MKFNYNNQGDLVMKKILSLSFFMLAIFSFAMPKTFTIAVDPNQNEYDVQAPASGVYWLKIHTISKLPVGQGHFIDLKWDDKVWQNRRLLHPNRVDHANPIERIVFGKDKRKLTLKYNHEDVTVAKLIFVPESTVKVPIEAQNYQMPITNMPKHPRLLVNNEILQKIKENLKIGINAQVWEDLQKRAKTPFVFDVNTDKEIMYDLQVSNAMKEKALYYLFTSDPKVGREVIDLTLNYLDLVAFGNGQDITRKVGEIIFHASLVYDYTYDMMSDEERKKIREQMLFLAAEMEIGWPPFLQSVVMGHGNEAQMSRDLLAMAIAIADEDPIPLKYATYAMLEMFKPAKEYMYQSGKHDQGAGYGRYRFTWDLFAELQFRRSFNMKLLPDNAENVVYYWHYIRTPDNRYLMQGDGTRSTDGKYRSSDQMLLTAISLWPSAELKEEFRRGNAKMNFPSDPTLFLLLNDPNLQPESNRQNMPLTKFYGKPLPEMIARSSWNFNKKSDSVIVQMIGAYNHFRNHQHLDMGAFQIYYKGLLAGDLGQYRFYGLPYDWNFAKSSVSHSVMRFIDPEQKSYLMGPQFTANTGTQEVKNWWPASDLKELTKDQTYRNGETLRSGFGADLIKPNYSFIESDLGILYPNRVKSYSRSMVFFNLGLTDTPAVLVVLDRFEKAKNNIEPVFQLTSIATPIIENNNVVVSLGTTPDSGKLTMQTLIPDESQKIILSGKDAHTVGGVYFEPRNLKFPEATGSRVEITGNTQTYLNLLQIQNQRAQLLPVKHTQNNGRIILEIADYILNFGDTLALSDSSISITISNPQTKLLILDLKSGVWALEKNAQVIQNQTVKSHNNSAYFVLDQGEYLLRYAD